MPQVNHVGGAINGTKMLGVATQAKRGELSAEEIAALQALRPDVPYPGRMPDPTGPKPAESKPTGPALVD